MVCRQTVYCMNGEVLNNLFAGTNQTLRRTGSRRCLPEAPHQRTSRLLPLVVAQATIFFGREVNPYMRTQVGHDLLLLSNIQATRVVTPTNHLPFHVTQSFRSKRLQKSGNLDNLFCIIILPADLKR